MVRKEEWSGILFYDMEGSIKDIANMVVTPKDILFMDIGNSVHTDYEFNEDVLEYQLKNNLLKTKFGHIHSHNTMNVWFSGEDIDELRDNSPNHNIYLSLIVNNFDEMVARIAFLVKPHAYKTVDENGNEYVLGVEGLDPMVFSYDCEIEKPAQNPVEKSMLDRFEKIAKQSSTKKAKQSQNLSKSGQGLGYGMSTVPGYSSKINKPEANYSEEATLFALGDYFAERESGSIIDVPETGDFDEFICYFIRSGALASSEDTIKAALIAVNDLATTCDLATSLFDNYDTLYSCFYDISIEEEDKDTYLDAIAEVIFALEVHEKEHKWLEKLISLLQEKATKLEQETLTKE